MVTIPAGSLDVKETIAKQRDFFGTGKTKNVDFRIAQLKKLAQLIKEHEQEILDAVYADLHKPAMEAFGSEILITLSEIKYVLKNIKAWVKPQKVGTPINLFPSSSFIYTEPLGVVLIVAPWNYPFALMMQPLIGAIAAGNCATLKPSEHTPNTSSAIAKIINDNFDSSFISAIEGGIETNQALLAEKFDHIFFTGGTAIGKIVMEAAAKHLTPVTLELGGKSPCIVDESCNLDITVKRIIWGKFYNAGQTCVAPDYLLLHRNIKDALLVEMETALVDFYGADPLKSADYACIINQKHFERLKSLIRATKGSIRMGGTDDATSRHIAPTIVELENANDPLMIEEIFGPILPVLTFSDFSEVETTIRAHSNPLALYLFSKNSKTQEWIREQIPFGGGCFNDTLVHLGNPRLPFGGIGESGMGAYHGKFSFDIFTHRKSIVRRSFFFDTLL